jgi:hypothetical protein
MLKALLIAIFCSLLLLGAGCANQYVVTMTNAMTIRSSTKPKLNERGYYILTDTMTGRTVEVNSMRVRSIEAVSKGEATKLPFQR